ncbi:MAG: hypothetical protein LBS84_08830 [Clostridiales bacterium]|jgi:glycerophosphoryl diester phosphodiesterase|nr:hypothetical protein [Clostridiales bacterium]
MRFFWAALCALLVLPGCSDSAAAVFAAGGYAPEWTNTAAGLVAHAGGNVDGVQGTNTIEAVEYNYSIGHRVFELDFNLTSDDVLVGVHDWGAENIAPAWAEFSSGKIQGKYTPTSYEQFIRFLSQHSDTYMVTDTKSYDLTDERIAKQFQIMYDTAERVDPAVLERVIVQVYNQNMYHVINKIYKYPNILYTLYATPDTEDQVVEFVKTEGIPVVVMPPERANQPFLDRLLALSARVYLHTLNDYNEVMEWRAKGVWSVYTDSLSPGDFTW